MCISISTLWCWYVNFYIFCSDLKCCQKLYVFFMSDTLSYCIHQCLVICYVLVVAQTLYLCHYILVTARTYVQLCHGLNYKGMWVQFRTMADQLWGSNWNLCLERLLVVEYPEKSWFFKVHKWTQWWRSSTCSLSISWFWWELMLEIWAWKFFSGCSIGL